MTTEQIESLELDITPINGRTKLIIESGLEWLLQNTTLEFDINTGEGLGLLPACTKLFLLKFYDIQTLSAGVASESIDGMSQSFDTGNRENLVWKFAEEMLYPYLKSRVRFVAAKKRWG